MMHAAGIIVIRKDGAVLMQHRDNKPDIFWPDYWGYPSGLVEENEDVETAAKRELLEETNYEPGIVYFLIEEEQPLHGGGIVRRHIFWTMYDEQQEIQCNEGAEMKFLKLEELKGKKIVPGQERLCHLAAAEARAKGWIEGLIA